MNILKAAANIEMVEKAALDACAQTNPENIVACHIVILARMGIDGPTEHTQPIIGTLVSRIGPIEPEVAYAQGMELLQKQLQHRMNQLELSKDRDDSEN